MLFFLFHIFTIQIYTEMYVSLLFREPLYIPLANTFDIPHDEFKSLKVKGRDAIEGNVGQNKRPLEERVNSVSYKWEEIISQTNLDTPDSWTTTNALTTSDLVNLVLNKKVNQWYQCTKKGASHNLAPSQGARIVRTERKTTKGPR